MEGNKKYRTSFYADKAIMKEADKYIDTSDSENRSEYINKALEFYNGYNASIGNEDYFANVITTTIDSIIKATESRLARMGFKQAVEISKIVYMVAPLCNLNEDYLQRLHAHCIEEVSKINGTIEFKSSFDYKVKGKEQSTH